MHLTFCYRTLFLPNCLCCILTAGKIQLPYWNSLEIDTETANHKCGRVNCWTFCRAVLITRLQQLSHRISFAKICLQQRKLRILRRCLEVQILRWFLGSVFTDSVKLKRMRPTYRTLWTSSTGGQKWPCHKRGLSEEERSGFF